ncbi:MAG: Crp/Fnr family transcriptional regulator, partial [Hyphomicrobiaceae bacterium]|nr:Crp/Fnr family transcriptional regulator [Hyphomicrobiaceae bacterium]
MQHGEAAELLARVPVLRGIGGEFLSVIMQIGEPQRFAAHDTLVVAGMPARGALVVLEGEVTLYTEDGREFGDPLGPGDTVSEMAMIVETQHHFSAFGANDGFALKIGNEAFGQLMGQYPWLAAHLAQNIGQDLKATAKTLHGLDDMLVISEHELLAFLGDEDAEDDPDEVGETNEAKETNEVNEADKTDGGP